MPGAAYHKAWAAAGLLGASALFVANQDRSLQFIASFTCETIALRLAEFEYEMKDQE